MSKRVAIAAILAILAVTFISTMVQEKRSSVPPAQSSAASDSPKQSPFATASVPPPNPPQEIDAFATGEQTLSPSASSPGGRSPLKTLEHAALGGDARAQFRLSRAMRHCTVVLAYSEDSIRAMADPLRRSYLLQSRDECAYFADRRERLVDEAFDWERRAADAADPGARAMQIGLQVNNGELQAHEAEEKLASLLASNDPFVFATVARLGMTNGINAESAAWHMLACEDEGPAELCSIMNDAISDACTGDVRCGNTGHEVDVAQYYLHAHPNLFDIARGRYLELKDQLQYGRSGEIELQLAAPSSNQ